MLADIQAVGKRAPPVAERGSSLLTRAGDVPEFTCPAGSGGGLPLAGTRSACVSNATDRLTLGHPFTGGAARPCRRHPMRANASGLTSDMRGSITKRAPTV